MKFAHLSDVHIGGWREPRMKDLNLKAFLKAVDICIQEMVDFVIISGDLFNTALPAVDNMKEAVKKLKELQKQDIPVYVIPGSHDFSPSGKTMLDVLEHTGLFVNVFKGDIVDGKLRLKFTVDTKTGAKLTGIIGKKGMLDRKYYEVLDYESLENEKGFKIFVFHTALAEFKPAYLEKMDAMPLSNLPKGFNYYAAGHVHHPFKTEQKEYGSIAWPGALFPNNFRELEKFGGGGFYIWNDGKLEWKPVQVCNTLNIEINCSGKTAVEVENELIKEIGNKEFNDTVVLLRLHGVLESGKPSDIDINSIFSKLYEKSAYFVMKNTYDLTSKELEQVQIQSSSVEEIEEKLIAEHVEQIKVEGFSKEQMERLTNALMQALNKEKIEGERQADFEKRIIDEAFKTLQLE